jgi:hypothetical protein
MARAMAVESTAAVLGSRRFARETLVLSLLADYDNEKVRYVLEGRDASLYFAYTNNMAVQREAFDRCGPFVELARGGDTLLMGNIVEAYSCDAVRFVPEMVVRHLEMERWYHWHRKMWTYGRSYAAYSRLGMARSLEFRDRRAILRRTACRHRYAWIRTALLLLMGIAAGIAFEAGVGIAELRKKLGTRKHTE